MNYKTRSLVASLAIGLLIGIFLSQPADAWLFGLWKPKKQVTKTAKHTLVIFPFDVGSGFDLPEGFGEAVAADVRTMLTNSDFYLPFLYRSRLAPIQRAKEDNVLKTADIEPPFAEDRTKTLKLAQLLAADYYLVGEIDNYQIDRTKRVAEITLKADLYNARTGKLIKTLLVSGRTPESAAGDEDELRDIAKGTAVTKLVAELLTSLPKEAEAKPAPVKTEEAKPSSAEPGKVTEPASPSPQAGNTAESKK
ncbi:MAG: hypothetical protein QHI38_00400 [Armatimonadota bacterium]|nr:hypothetical protein [Armatimonadota bacterium]